MNAPSPQHERIVGNLLFATRLWLRQAGRLGEWTTQQPVPINERRGYQPDASWFPAEQCGPPGEPARFIGLPAIVVEVLSPSTRSLDLLRKRGDYERIGIAELWVLDPESSTALVLRRQADRFVDVAHTGHDELSSSLLPGLTIPIASLFVA